MGPAPGWQPAERAGLPVLVWRAAPGLEALVTTRHGGVSTGPFASLNLGLHVGDTAGAVLENRARAAAAVGARIEDLVVAHQMHGTRSRTVGPGDRGPGGKAAPRFEADALVCATPGPVLMTLVADCAPIILFDPEASVLACVHAGWRGTMAGVAASALREMARQGARAERVLAGIGPAVDPSHYEVGEDVAAAARRAFGEDLEGILVARSPAGPWCCDLVAANRRALMAAGVAPEHIEVAPATTGAGGPFFSDRAARPCGRFGLLARISR
jgi:YfiH family protein